jgi:hypothetical protein
VKFNEADPRHYAVAQALCDQLGYGSFVHLGTSRPAVESIIEAALTAATTLSWASPGHRMLATCPGCGQAGLDRIGIDKLAYEWVTCECGNPGHPHLVEQLWHRDHLARTGDEVAATIRQQTWDEALKAAEKALRDETRADPFPRQQLTYEGGLRRAGRVVRRLRDWRVKP